MAFFICYTSKKYVGEKMKENLKELISFYLLLSIPLFIISYSFNFFPFLSSSARDIIFNFALFSILFTLPVIFLIHLFKILMSK